MFFSIVTVTYNAEQLIKKTLDSLQTQTFNDYELIVVDGESADSTIDIVKKYMNCIKNMKIISEPDKGIYDAMNKGVNAGKGDYVYFLNAGDYLVDSNVLYRVYKYINSDIVKRKGNVIYHGNIIREGKLKTFPPIYKKWRWIYFEHAYFSHQAIFTNREALIEAKFDLLFPICADRDWFIRTMDNGGSYIYMDTILVANYSDGGVSSGYKKQQDDSLRISRKYGGFKAYIFVKIKRKIGEILGHER